MSNTEPSSERTKSARTFQLVQHTCEYHADTGVVKCKPFVRTFLEMAGGSLKEITPLVNGNGGRLPNGAIGVEESIRGDYL